MRQTTSLAAGLAALGLAVLIGCSDSIVGDDPDTGLTVSVFKGPIQPVAREGEDNSAPVADALVRVTAPGGGHVEERTGPAGSVRINLAPGNYIVEVRECPGALSLPGPEETEVRSGLLADVLLMCDTGIR